ncbi:MAG: chromate transporter [Alphaproteobacteria bacterium]|nr:chromate transporter [Alphaproteobacteria bacterium]
MIYLTLFYEFFLIGLFAIGGGTTTIPFLFDLSAKYNWFSPEELTNMVAVSESTPGPIGINMATYAGYKTASYFGSIIATLGLVTPSVVIIILVSMVLKRYACNNTFKHLLQSLQPAVVALVLNATLQIAEVSLTGILPIFIFAFLLAFMHIYKANSVFYIILAGILGLALKL